MNSTLWFSLRFGPSLCLLQIVSSQGPIQIASSTMHGPSHLFQPLVTLPESPREVASIEHFATLLQEGRVGPGRSSVQSRLLCVSCSKQVSSPTPQVWKRSGAWFYKGLPKYILPLKTPGQTDDPHLRPLPVEPAEQEPRSTETSRVYTWARGRGKSPLPLSWDSNQRLGPQPAKQCHRHQASACHALRVAHTGVLSLSVPLAPHLHPYGWLDHSTVMLAARGGHLQTSTNLGAGMMHYGFLKKCSNS